MICSERNGQPTFLVLLFLVVVAQLTLPLCGIAPSVLHRILRASLGRAAELLRATRSWSVVTVIVIAVVGAARSAVSLVLIEGLEAAVTVRSHAVELAGRVCAMIASHPRI